MPEDCRRFWGY